VPLAPELPRSALRRLRGLLAVFFAIGIMVGPLAAVASAASPITMTAKVLLQGHARVGTWMAHPDRAGQQRAGGQGRGPTRRRGSGRTRFSVPVDSRPTPGRPTSSTPSHRPSADRQGRARQRDKTISSADVRFLAHDATQLVIGILAEQPQGSSAS